MPQPSEKSSPEAIQSCIRAFRNGDESAAARLSKLLRGPIIRNVVSFLGPDSADEDDLVQVATIETMKYLRRETEFAGNVVNLAVTIARNRCRDLKRWRRRHPQADFEGLNDWLSDPASSVLEQIETRERLSLLQRVLSRLAADCRSLLKALYLDAVPTEVLRKSLGLGSVHAVYYRREVCLKRAREFLQELLEGRSGGGSSEVEYAREDTRHE